MLIQQIVIDNKVYYQCGPVYTTVNGRRVWVSNGYTEESLAKVLKRAYYNASIRNYIANMAENMTWKRGDGLDKVR